MTKKQFEMDQDEFDEIMSISKDSTPVMKFGDYWSGMDKFEEQMPSGKSLLINTALNGIAPQMLEPATVNNLLQLQKQ